MNKNEDIILKTAKDMFSRKGFEGTIMDELAKKAGVNKATIYYHFKNKEALYEHVFTECIKKVVEDLEKSVSEVKDAKEGLRLYIDTFYFHAKRDRTFIGLFLREIAGGGRSFPKKAMEIFLRVLSILEEILKKGYENGVFRKSDTKLVHFMIVGSVSFFLSTQEIRRKTAKLLGDTVENFADSADINEQLYKIILKGLEKK